MRSPRPVSVECARGTRITVELPAKKLRELLDIPAKMSAADVQREVDRWADAWACGVACPCCGGCLVLSRELAETRDRVDARNGGRS